MRTISIGRTVIHRQAVTLVLTGPEQPERGDLLYAREADADGQPTGDPIARLVVGGPSSTAVYPHRVEVADSTEPDGWRASILVYRPGTRPRTPNRLGVTVLEGGRALATGHLIETAEALLAWRTIDNRPEGGIH